MHDGDMSVDWEWLGTVNKSDGRPYFSVNGRRTLAYRIAYEAYYGKELPNAVLLRHSCDNRICCNPTHLTEGTHEENMQDMRDRDRHGLPKTVVRNIRKLIKEGRTHAEIAKLYGTARETVTAIANDRRQKDAGDYDDAQGAE